MKTAFLVLAHDQPLHLLRLVNAVTADWSRVFIHVDRKSDIDPFISSYKKSRYTQQKSPIYLSDKKRVEVNWGGFSIVQATLNLLQESINSGGCFDRFCLLSGSDYPIKNIELINESFCLNKEYIRIDCKITDNESAHCPIQMQRYVKRYHFIDSPRLSRSRMAMNLISRIPRKVYNKIEIYKGSQWFALTRDCVLYILSFIEENKDYIRYFRSTLCSDEMFFHSIVKSSPFANNITHDFEKSTDITSYSQCNDHGCHYVDWNTKNIKLPKVLDENDIENLLSSKALFARKFRETESSRLLDMIDEHTGNSLR